MNFNFKNVRSIQLEISNYCNAACPQCPRNYFGGKTIETLKLKKWSLSEFTRVFNHSWLEQINEFYFCGSYGDPLTNSNIVKMCQFLKEKNKNIKIGIHTNGGVGSKKTFSELANCVDYIAFGIDGLEDTNHIYRRNVLWKKVLENLTEFVKNNGYAIWDFIVFEHNQHQVEEARKLSKDLGFKEFSVKKTSRFLNRKHQYSDTLDVYNNSGSIEYQIKLPSNKKYVNAGYNELHNVLEQFSNISEYAKNTKIKCNALRINEIYIGADGLVFPCGWLHDRLHGPEIKNHLDNILINKLINDSGGFDNCSVFYNDLNMIVNGKFFEKIKESWNSNNRLERCSIMCGQKINLIKNQNEEINYKD